MEPINVNDGRNGTIIVERRKRIHLRAIYDDATERVSHFFHGHTDWVGSPIEYLAQRVVHETYPDLDGGDVRVLVQAIERQLKNQFMHA